MIINGIDIKKELLVIFKLLQSKDVNKQIEAHSSLGLLLMELDVEFNEIEPLLGGQGYCIEQ